LFALSFTWHCRCCNKVWDNVVAVGRVQVGTREVEGAVERKEEGVEEEGGGREGGKGEERGK
jgi:hypothetical protein